MKRGPVIELPTNEAVPATVIASLLDMLEQPILISDRYGRILQANLQGRQKLESLGFSSETNLNLFSDLLRMHPKTIADRIEGGEQQIDSNFECCGGAAAARIQWLPEADWLVVRIEDPGKRAIQAQDPATQHTVQELLQEREITYRNLLAAYLRLQEVNRQKTVFLASAAHELKTPLAVIKGYYDLLLSGSLGKLTDKQRDILQESKESCERLVRLVSMFLNYSALESGKLVLHLRENDLRDCLTDQQRAGDEAFIAQACAARYHLEFRYPDIQVRLSKSAADCCQSAGQFPETHALRRDGHLPRRAALLGAALSRGNANNGAPPRAQFCSPIASRFPCRIPVRELRPNITRKSLKILCAWTAPLRAWDWVWPSPSGWCRRIEAKFGWRANHAEGAPLRSFCR